MLTLRQKIEETVKAIREKIKFEPEIGVILGTGLGSFTEKIKSQESISYSSLPHFPLPTVQTHQGALSFGFIEKKPILVLEGRFHYYEGYSLEEVTYPVRIIKALGAGILIVSNASGGLNPLFKPGDIMIIDDHINLMGVNPLIGPNDDSLGPRYPDMCEPYNRDLIQLAEEVALEEKIRIQRGVYVGLTGPSLETRAEYRFLRLIGADAVGMSTVPEVIVAVHSGLKVLGISCITDSCLPDCLEPVDIAKIIKVAQDAEPDLTRLVIGVIKKIK